ncbi:MAG TPA: 3'-5' exonuclease, partial [Longimicrobiales bacterium]|nr:3'-5' exonuclease [Longimicrobiales bacterium]
PPLPLSVNFRSEPQVIDFVNAVGAAVIGQTAANLQQICGDASVAYTQLSAHRASSVGAVEWIAPENGAEATRRASEGAHVAKRITELIENGQITDPESGQPRPCRYSDIAILYRARTGLSVFHDALRKWGVPYFEHSPIGLTERQEVQDLLNILRLLHNPADDLCAFAFLRSPFVGLRDEVLVRMRMNGGWGRYLDQATRFLARGEWFAAPEHADLADIEQSALRAGLDLFKRARTLADRLALDELLEFVLSESGYRQHLLLLQGSREALANIQSFLHMIEQFRDHTIGRFLQLWDSRDDEDPGVPQGQLFSAAENVVTLSTIHSAKGLEWPVVFLVDTGSPFKDASWGQYWSDPKLGPVLCPAQKERGPRSTQIANHNIVRDDAERARLLYVASTRARDRLVILAADDPKKKPSFARWLQAGRKLSTDLARPTPVFAGAAPPAIELSWLDAVCAGPTAPTAQVLPRPPQKFITSATEEMARARDPDSWALIYRYGMEPVWLFAPRGRRKEFPERLRGDVIHGVLERITPELAIAQVLEETIGELDAPELEFVLAPGTEQRAELEAEIERVITGAEWNWYVKGEHYRELPFLHLAAPREWRIGAFDLYRPDGWIVDFKTHQLTADRTARAAEDYRLQMRIYRDAASIAVVVRTRLHFTHSNSVIDLS